jgi:hypothetical protein
LQKTLEAKQVELGVQKARGQRSYARPHTVSRLVND